MFETVIKFSLHTCHLLHNFVGLNSFLASGEYVIFTNSLDLDQDNQKVSPAFD